MNEQNTSQAGERTQTKEVKCLGCGAVSIVDIECDALHCRKCAQAPEIPADWERLDPCELNEIMTERELMKPRPSLERAEKEKERLAELETDLVQAEAQVKSLLGQIRNREQEIKPMIALLGDAMYALRKADNFFESLGGVFPNHGSRSQSEQVFAAIRAVLQAAK